MEPKDVQAARNEIHAEYKVIAGRIRTPGKFEACWVYAPYFHAAVGNGCAGETVILDDVAFDWFEITDAEREVFPELGAAKYAVCWEDSQGFFHATTAGEQELADARTAEGK